MSLIATTRRRMLLGLAAASTAAATGAGATGTTGPQEAPELVAMGDSLSDTLNTYKAAAKRVQVIAETWGPQWPQPHPDTFCFTEGSKTHADILGRPIPIAWKPGGFERVQNVGTAECFEAWAKREWTEYHRRMSLKSQRGAKIQKKFAERMEGSIEHARAYWAEVDRIKNASGIEAAQKAQTEAREALQELVGRIILFREKSVTGLIIKAQAMQAWGEVPALYQQCNLQAIQWAEALTATVLRQATPT